jgi:hypothetical protein
MSAPLHIINRIIPPKSRYFVRNFSWHSILYMYCFGTIIPWALSPQSFYFPRFNSTSSFWISMVPPSVSISWPRSVGLFSLGQPLHIPFISCPQAGGLSVIIVLRFRRAENSKVSKKKFFPVPRQDVDRQISTRPNCLLSNC